MKTDVYFAKDGPSRVIAYKNAKNQNVFLQIGRAEYAPSIQSILICDSQYDIGKVIENAFQYTLTEVKNIEIGIKQKYIWKPLLQQNIQKELDFDIPELYRAKRNLSILMQKLQELLLYVEPSSEGLKAYSHKIKETLILACTELENYFKIYELGKNKRTADYIKILELVDLTKYKISLVGYINPYKCCPFETWNTSGTTQSISWYDAYTKIKHNSNKYFHLATLENCINAISANIIMFAIRYSPISLYNEFDTCSQLTRGSVDFRIEDTEDIYIPIYEGKKSHVGSFDVPYIFKNGESIHYTYDIHEQISLIEGPIK